MLPKLKNLVLVAVLMTFIVIVLGAYTRLKDAGLGCPDWPGCYGNLLAPSEDSKAWIEMIHRYVASTLGLLILIIAVRTIQLHKQQPRLVILAASLLVLVILQGLLGMWTVTLRLYPIVVIGHLLGGFAILATAWLLYLFLTVKHKAAKASTRLKLLGCLSLIVVIIQIALGGWTSANYAALVCADFPTCQGQLWPPMDWAGAFDLTAIGIFDSPGIPLENTARVTIQMAHRVGALITSLILIIFSYHLIASKRPKLINKAIFLIVLLIVQLGLGLSNILARLPLTISLMHNAVAALLLLLLINILLELYDKSSSTK